MYTRQCVVGTGQKSSQHYGCGFNSQNGFGQEHLQEKIEENQKIVARKFRE